MQLFCKQKERYKEAFFIALGVAFIFFIPFIIYDKGYFFFYGDFNVQQIPFYKTAHQAVRSGNIFWNWNTDLGVNFIGSYTFYLLGSPFFWLTIPFPNWMVPHLIGPLLMLKFACASLTAYCYLRRFCRNKDYALIGALLYAFCGFSVYNIFFNHFHEAIVYFPLLLLSLELLVADNRRGPFAFIVFLSSLSNYYFFVGMCVFLVIYWAVRTLSGCWRMDMRIFGKILLEGVIGIGLAAIILIPSYYSVIQNNRVGGYLTGWNMLLYNKNQRFLNIIQCFFFPPDNPARPVFFPDADAKWSSQAGWLPLFGMTGVIAWLSNRRKTWQRRLIITLLFMALIPVLNSTFQLFNYAYYARWFYMLELMMVLATVQSLDRADIDWSTAFRWSAGITLAFTLAIGLIPQYHSKEDGFTDFGLYNKDGDFYKLRFWVECLIALVCVGLLIALFTYRGNIFAKKKNCSRGEMVSRLRKKAPRFVTMCICLICIVSVGYAGIFIYWGKLSSNDTIGFIIPDLLEGNFELEDSDQYRVDVYSGMDNEAMYLGLPTIQAFHSIVPASVMDYYPYVGVDRGVASRPETSVYQIRSFLNCRYLIDSTKNSSDFDETTMPGWSYYGQVENHDVWENQYCIPYGFTYDMCITEDNAKQYEGNSAALMLKAMIVTNIQKAKYSDVLKSVDSIPGEDFSENAYYLDCLARRATSVNNTFSVDNRGFTSGVDLDRKNLVFYAVPYEDGWTAYVDGKKVDIEKVNIGFMAVLVGEGKHTVRFEYMTPGLKIGAAITGAASLGFVAYILLWYIYKRKNPDKCIAVYPEGKRMRAEWEEDDRLAAEWEEHWRTLALTETVSDTDDGESDKKSKKKKSDENPFAAFIDEVFDAFEKPSGGKKSANKRTTPDDTNAAEPDGTVTAPENQSNIGAAVDGDSLPDMFIVKDDTHQPTAENDADGSDTKGM